jgi:hypothetical protein
MGYVYVIECPERQLIKVGMTNGAPARRLAQLQTGQPDPLRLLYAWAVLDAARAERCMHQLLAAQHYRGEWFNVTPDQVIAAWARVVAGRLGVRFRLRWWWARLRRWGAQWVGTAARWTGFSTWLGILLLFVYAGLHTLGMCTTLIP